jgi:hypothetical protein
MRLKSVPQVEEAEEAIRAETVAAETAAVVTATAIRLYPFAVWTGGQRVYLPALCPFSVF